MIVWWLGPRKATLTIFLLTIYIHLWDLDKRKTEIHEEFRHLDWQSSGLLEGLGTETIRLSLISRAGFLCHSSESQWHRISFGWMFSHVQGQMLAICHDLPLTERTSWDVMASHDAISGFLIINGIGWNSTTNKNWLMAHPVDGLMGPDPPLQLCYFCWRSVSWRNFDWKFPPKKHGFPLHVETSSCQSGPDKPTIELESLKDIWRERKMIDDHLQEIHAALWDHWKEYIARTGPCDFVVPCLAETPHPQGSAGVRYLKLRAWVPGCGKELLPMCLTKLSNTPLPPSKVFHLFVHRNS